MTERERLLKLLRRQSVLYGDFVLTSGATSKYYIDVRLTSMSGLGMLLIGQVCLAAIDDQGWSPELVGGLTLAADPVAYAIAHHAALSGHALDAFTVRKEPKDHGTKRLIEGPYREGARVVVIEDVVTSGGSALKAVAALVEAKARVLGVLALVDREQGGMTAIADAGHKAVALFTASELLVT